MTGKNGYSRRDFLKVVGAGTGLAASGCAEELPEKIIPYVIQPDEVIPGVATWYAGACNECSAGCGVLVRTREGRAVKVEGNPRHPVSQGGLCAHGQSSIQAHYDPDRVREPLQREPSGTFRSATWAQAVEQVAGALTGLGGKRAVLLTPPLSGSIRSLVSELKTVVPTLEHLEFELSGADALRRAARLIFGEGVTTHFDFSQARVIASFGADFLETWVSPVEFSRQWAQTRRPEDDEMDMSYFVHFESRLSLTAGNADRWIKTAPGFEVRSLAALLRAVADEQRSRGRTNAEIQSLAQKMNVTDLLAGSGVTEEFVRDLAKRLVDAPASLVVAGGAACSGQSVAAAVLANSINIALGNVGKTVFLRPVSDNASEGSYERLLDLVQGMQKGTDKVGVFFVSGINPLYILPEKSGLGAALAKVDLVVSASTHLDETAYASNVILPLSTSFESWCDGEAAPGLWNLNQPSMSPLYQTQSLGDTILALGLKLKGDFNPAKSFHEYIKNEWKERTASESGNFEDRWISYVERGGEWDDKATPDSFLGQSKQGSIGGAAIAAVQSGLKNKPAAGLSLLVYPSINSFDGRSANRPWMQELPNPVTTSVWGSWVEIHPETAAKYHLADGDVVQVRSASGTIEAPVYLTKFVHPDLVAVPIGQGHDQYGRYAAGVGANALDLLPHQPSQGDFALAVSLSGSPTPLTRTISQESLVKVHFHDSQEGRGITRTVGLSKLAKHTAVTGAIVGGAHGGEHHGEHAEAGHHDGGHGAHGGGHHGDALGPQPPPRQMYEQMDHPLYQWGMAVDLASCTGCSACVVACYAENNIPVVGKEIVSQGREMSWLRIERYYEEDAEQPVAGYMPVMCQHCQNAPCEPVCPVYATYHNEEGINTMVYNRCVGTRYCSNNCTYKVRRFNWFRYNWPEPLTWQLNPDVTVREVGIMEKCTFCVQRINEAKNIAKDLGRPVLDGEVQPACASSCPTKAITFGNLLDKKSRVSQLAAGNRSYKVLDAHINTQPSVSYLARVRNDSTMRGA